MNGDMGNVVTAPDVWGDAFMVALPIPNGESEEEWSASVNRWVGKLISLSPDNNPEPESNDEVA